MCKTVILLSKISDGRDRVDLERMGCDEDRIFDNEKTLLKELDFVTYVYDLVDFTQMCNDEEFDPEEYWIGYAFIGKKRKRMFEVSCYSKCPTSFEYLQYIHVIAKSEEEALQMAREDSGDDFISNNLKIREISGVDGGGIVYKHWDSDY